MKNIVRIFVFGVISVMICGCAPLDSGLFIVIDDVFITQNGDLQVSLSVENPGNESEYLLLFGRNCYPEIETLAYVNGNQASLSVPTINAVCGTNASLVEIESVSKKTIVCAYHLSCPDKLERTDEVNVIVSLNGADEGGVSKRVRLICMDDAHAQPEIKGMRSIERWDRKELTNIKMNLMRRKYRGEMVDSTDRDVISRKYLRSIDRVFTGTDMGSATPSKTLLNLQSD